MARPDREEKVIRFGCGTLAGLVLGFGVAMKERVTSWGVFVGILLGMALVCGWLAMREGDKFWIERTKRKPWY